MIDKGPEQPGYQTGGLHGSTLLSLERLESCFAHLGTAVIFDFCLEFRENRVVVVLFVDIAPALAI